LDGREIINITIIAQHIRAFTEVFSPIITKQFIRKICNMYVFKVRENKIRGKIKYSFFIGFLTEHKPAKDDVEYGN